MGGALLSFGAMLALMVGGGSHGLAENNPGLNKLITAASESMERESRGSAEADRLLQSFPLA